MGHAVLCARPVVGNEPFMVILADDLIEEDTEEGGAMSQMVRHFNKYQCSILGVERVPKSETQKYGIVHPLPFATRLSNVDSIVEKPKPEVAPSTLGVVGRYILTPRIFHHLERVGGEGVAAVVHGFNSICLNDAISRVRPRSRADLLQS